MKRALALILVAVMAMSLMACSQTAKPQADAAPKTEAAQNETKPAETKTEETKKDPIVLRMGTKMGAETMDGQAFQKFADLVQEKTENGIRIEVYPAGQLGDGPTMINNVVLGTQDLYVENYAEATSITPLADLAAVPFLFNTVEQYFEIMNGEFGAMQEAALEAGGIKVVRGTRNWVRGPYRVICATKPIESLDDLKNLRLRTWDSAAYMKCWEALGTNPLVIGWNDAYLALQQGTVQAVTSPASQIEDMGFYEVAPYVTNINEFPQEVLVMMNVAKWNSLSAEYQSAMMEAAEEAGAWATEEVYKYMEESKARMSAAGASFYEIDTSSFTELLTPVYKELSAGGAIPADLLAILGIE